MFLGFYLFHTLNSKNEKKKMKIKIIILNKTIIYIYIWKNKKEKQKPRGFDKFEREFKYQDQVINVTEMEREGFEPSVRRTRTTN